MTSKILLSLGVAACGCFLLAAADNSEPGAQPPAGFVPDAKTAIKIAVAVWEPIYGEKQIAQEKPYHAQLGTNGVWVVEGTFHSGWLFNDAKGGVALAEIAKADGRILKIIHG